LAAKQTDTAGNTSASSTGLGVTINTSSPTDITLSNATASTLGAANTIVGSLSSTDATPGDTFTYSLVAGTGDTNNVSFNINGSDLRVNDPAALGAGTYSVLVRTTDAAGNTFDEAQTITLSNNTVPVLDLNGGIGGTGNSVTLANAANGLAAAGAIASDAENDSANWDGGSLTVQRVTSGGTADGSVHDVFSFTGGGSFSATGSIVKGTDSSGTLLATADSTQFATWSYTSSTGKLAITFDTDANSSLVQDVVRHIGYSNTTPYGNATIRMELSDSTSTTNADVAVTSNVIYVTRTDSDADGDAADGFSLAEALAIANDGDTILLADGTYRGQFDVTKAVTIDAVNGAAGHVTIESPNSGDLVGVAPEMLTNNGRWRMPVINIDTDGANGTVTVKNITIDGRDQAVVDGFNGNKDMLGIGIVDSNAVIDNVIIKNIRSNEAANEWGYSENYGILAEAGSALGAVVNVTITNSQIYNYQKTGIIAWGPNLNVTITDNEITGVGLDGACGQNGMQIGSANADRSGTTGTISGNTITSLSFENSVYGATGIMMRQTGDMTVTDNTVSGPANGLGSVAGISVYEGKAGSTFSISGNSFENVDYGIFNEFVQGTINLAIGENDFSGAVYATLDSHGSTPYCDTASVITLNSSHVPANNSKLLYLLFDGNDSFSDTGSVASAVYGGGGNDSILTGSGNDMLVGGLGNDTLTGSNGEDVFMYLTREPYPGYEADDPMYDIGISDLGIDTITDFGTGDLIRVTGRASTGGTVTVGDGTTVAANSIQLAVSGGTTTLYIDTDNTADAAELEIHLTGTYTAANFRLDGTDIYYVAPNSAPTLGSIPGSTQQVTTGVVAALPDFTVADTDGGTLTVTLAATNGTIGGLTDADPATPGIQLTGTAVQINTALAAATFTATTNGAAAIGFSLSDGVAAPVTATYNLNATAPVVNPPVVDPPVVPPVDPPVDPPVTPPTDDDNDGITATTEGEVPSLPPTGGGTTVVGDGNGDGVADNQQASVTSVPFLKTTTAVSNPTGAPPVYVTLVADSNAGVTDTTDTNSAQLTSVQQKDAPTGLPSEMLMPLGLISFVANVGTAGITETFSLFVDSSISFNGYWKQDKAGTWCNIATAIETVGGKTRIDFAITDGGAFDADGKADGIITDPGAIGSMPLSMVGELPVTTGTGFWF
jgi:hypothetical protein